MAGLVGGTGGFHKVWKGKGNPGRQMNGTALLGKRNPSKFNRRV